METSILQYMFGNPLTYQENKHQFRTNDATLHDCTTLPVNFDGEIETNADILNEDGTTYRKRGETFGTLHTARDTLTGKRQNYLFQGKPRLLCVLGKEISKIPTDTTGGYER